MFANVWHGGDTRIYPYTKGHIYYTDLPRDCKCLEVSSKTGLQTPGGFEISKLVTKSTLNGNFLFISYRDCDRLTIYRHSAAKKEYHLMWDISFSSNLPYPSTEIAFISKQGVIFLVEAHIQPRIVMVTPSGQFLKVLNVGSPTKKIHGVLWLEEENQLKILSSSESQSSPGNKLSLSSYKVAEYEHISS